MYDSQTDFEELIWLTQREEELREANRESPVPSKSEQDKEDFDGSVIEHMSQLNAPLASEEEALSSASSFLEVTPPPADTIVDSIQIVDPAPDEITDLTLSPEPFALKIFNTDGSLRPSNDLTQASSTHSRMYDHVQQKYVNLNPIFVPNTYSVHNRPKNDLEEKKIYDITKHLVNHRVLFNDFLQCFVLL